MQSGSAIYRPRGPILLTPVPYVFQPTVESLARYDVSMHTRNKATRPNKLTYACRND